MLYFKALHIIGVVVWFSGLFYLGRLFVYHREAADRPAEQRRLFHEQFSLMEKRLWYAITWPGLVITVVMGLALIYFFGLPPWLRVKLLLVLLLLGYHFLCGMIRQQLALEQYRLSSVQLRAFNEIPSLLLIGIVFVVVLKDQFSWVKLGLVLVVVAGLIGGVIMRRKRRLQNVQST